MKLRRVEVTNWKTGEKREALFHQFGLDLLEFSNGGGVSFSVAVIEYLDGTAELVPLQYIRFLDSPEALA